MNSIITQGKTTEEAIKKGLKQLNVKREQVEIRVLEEKSKRLFNILDPRIVKVELTIKENREVKIKEEPRVKREYIVSKEDIDKVLTNAKRFCESLFAGLEIDEAPEFDIEDNYIRISLKGEKLGHLIGYRGQTLDALQVVISEVSNKGVEQRVRIILDIAGYREKRKKTLTDLAVNMAKKAIRTGKVVSLEPMNSMERKIVHEALQEHSNVVTSSTGEEPRRKVVISLKR